MYPNNGQDAFPCYDNSPVLIENPLHVCCPAISHSFNAGARDWELDSLVYDFVPLIDQGYPGTPYIPAPGYTYQSPLPSTSQNINNVAAVLNSNTGLLTFTTYTSGTFNIVERVRSYRCSTLLSETMRFWQTGVKTNCPLNGNINHAPIIRLTEDSVILTADTDTVMPGDTVAFHIDFQDFDIDTSGSFQNFTVTASGAELDTGGGCAHPPCAVIDSVLPVTASGSYSTNFFWIPTCELIKPDGCLRHSATYSFTFRAADNYCPSNEITDRVYSIVISGPEITRISDSLHCPGNFVTYQWYHNGTLIPGADSADYIFTPGGDYYVIVTDAQGCELLSNTIHISLTSVNEIFHSNVQLSAFSEQQIIHLNLTSAVSSDEIINVTDITGKLVYSKRFRINTGSQIIPLNTSLSSGTYIVIMPGQNKVLKVVVND